MKKDLRRKILAALLSVAMVFSVMPTTVFAEEDLSGSTVSEVAADETLGESEDIEIASEETESSGWYSADAAEYTLTTAEQLAEFAALVNSGTDFAGKTVTLGADIDLAGYESWTPIGTVTVDTVNKTYTAGNAFAGTFNGNGKTISNLKIANEVGGVGLFGYSTGTLKDFTVSGDVTGNYYTAGVVAVGCGTISGVTNQVNVVAEGNCVGGILGDATGTVNISDCHNKAAITNNGSSAEKSTGRIAGIAGRIDTWAENSSIINCSNTGNITGYQYISGIVGLCAADTTIQACYNSGTLTGISFGKVYMGGIAGKLGAGTIDSCYNTGDINDTPWSDGHIRAVGGIAGCEEDHATGTAITNCYNTGMITLDTSKMTEGVKFVYESGNISGGHYPTYQNDMTYSNCYYLEGTFPMQNENHESYKYWCDNYKNNHLWIDTEYITSCTSDELMTAELGDYFVSGELYPVLYWQMEGGQAPEVASYAISTSVTGGTASIEAEESAKTGSTVNFTVSNVQSGKQLKSVIVTDASGAKVNVTEGSGTYSFVMPQRSVTIEVVLENEVAPGESYAITLPEGLDPIWNLSVDSTYYNDGKVQEGATVTIIVNKAEKAVTTSFDGITVKAGDTVIEVAESGVKYNEDSKYYAEYAFTMPSSEVQVELNATYTGFSVNVQKGETVTEVKTYTREQMENLGKDNVRAYYSGWSTETEPFIGVVDKYVTLAQILEDCGISFTEGCTLKVTGTDGFSQSYTYENLIGTARYYYSDIMQNGVNAAEKSEFAPTFTICANMTTDASQKLEDVVCDTLTTYRFVYGQSEEELTTSKKIVDAMPKSLAGLTVVKADDGCDTSWYNTEATEFTLTTAAQLKGFASIVNGTAEGIVKDNFEGKTVKLGNNIAVAADNLYTATADVRYGDSYYAIITTQYVLKEEAPIWTPIGSGTATSNTNATTDNAFAGTFDGAGYTISGIYTGTKDAANGNTDTVQGLFGVVTGTVKNVTVSGCITAKAVAGGIVAHLAGGTVENCVNNAIVLTDGGTTPSGNIENGASQLGATGGIVGNAMTGSSVTGCINNAPITCANSNRGGRSGGIIGLIDGTNDVVVISNNGNNGAIDSYQYAGGIVGLNFSSNAPITKCYNTGWVCGHSSGSTYVGGITAMTYSDISYCYNTGDYGIAINGSAGNKGAHLAGIVSDLCKRGTQPLVSHCYNTGKMFVGGNAGFTSSSGYICGTGYDGYNSGVGNVIYTPNCYALEMDSTDRLYEEDYTNGCVTALTAEEMKTADFVTTLNGEGRAFVMDTASINNGYPVLRMQTNDITYVTEITYEGKPVTNYVEGQTFDAGTMKIWAKFSDNTKEEVTVYSTNITEFKEEHSGEKLIVSGTHSGKEFEFSFTVSVAENNVQDMEITSQPTLLTYGVGEKISYKGLKVEVSYLNGITETYDDFTGETLPEGFEITPSVASESDNEKAITVSYTYKGKTLSEETTKTLTVVSEVAQAEDGYYELSTVNDMVWFAEHVNSGVNQEMNARLANDIDLSEVTWTPVGKSSYKYNGTFDGNGNSVTLQLSGSSNLGLFGYVGTGHIMNVTVNGSVSGTQYVAGIAARVSDAGVIENCTNNASIAATSSSSYSGGIVGNLNSADAVVKNCTNNGLINADGKNYAGGIAGYNYGTISGCTNNGDVQGKQYLGGIYGSGQTNATAVNCINKGNVTGTASYVGGIAGQKAKEITNCKNTGTVTGTTYIGGIIGNNAQALTITGCVNTGAVTGTNSVGGVIGYVTSGAATITNCYNKGTVTGTASSTNRGAGGIIGYNNYAGTTAVNCYNAGTVTGSNVLGTLIGYDTKAAVLTNCYYEGTAEDVYHGGTSTTENDTVTAKTADEMKTAEFVAALNGEGSAYMANNGDYPILNWESKDAGWYNTTDSEYVITTAAQLRAFAEIVNGTAEGIAQDNFAGKTVKLGNDIALAADGLYTTINDVVYGGGCIMKTTQYVLKEEAPIWVPIGSGTATSNTNATTANAFAGTFDGQGYTVSGIYTGTKDETKGNSDTVQGLFGVVTGTVKNVTVSGCITAKMVVGGIVANLAGGTIENCTNNAIVFADGGTTPGGNVENGGSKLGAVGGITGNVTTGSSVTGCTNNAAVTCANTYKGGRTGGIIGLIDSSSAVVTIYANANNGDIDSYQYTGGIVGANFSKNAPIDKCYNTGDVSGHSPGSTYVGGIVSHMYSNVSHCYNTGAVIGNRLNGDKAAHYGGIVSDFYGSSITNCYNVGQILDEKNKSSYGQICGTGYGSKTNNKLKNCYGLEGLYGEDVNNSCVIIKTSDDMKTEDFVALLNGDGRIFVADNATTPINDGYPILRMQTTDTSILKNITVEGEPVTSYVDGQTFDKGTMRLWANYSDNTREEVTNYSVNITEYTADNNGDKLIISGTYGGVEYEFTYRLSVAKNKLTNLELTAEPSLMTYYVGENLNVSGMKVKITYLNEKTETVSLTNELPEGFEVTPSVISESDDEQTVKVSYTYSGKTLSVETTKVLTVIPEVKQSEDGYYEIASADDMLWFAEHVNTGVAQDMNVRLTKDVDLSEVTWPSVGTYNGTFDGNGKTVTLNVSGGNNTGLFGTVGTGHIMNVTVDGTVTGGQNVAAITGRVTGEAVIENCVNKATVTGTNTCVGGIIGQSTGAVVISNCANKGAVTGTNSVAGIVGYISSKAATITNCYNTGAITSTDSSTNRGTAGIIGYNAVAGTTATNCYNAGTVTGANVLGALIGYDTKGAVLTNCYYLGTEEDVYHGGTASIENDTVTAKTSDELKAAEFVTALNGEGAAYIVNTNCYPVLSWETTGHIIVDDMCTVCGGKAGLLGDVNDDGKVNLKDAILLQRYVAGMVTEINEYAANVNQDATINLKDAILLQRYVAGMISSFN